MSTTVVTEKIKAVAGSADSAFTNNLTNVIEKYNDLALKYKSERSKNKELNAQNVALTNEVEKLREEIQSYHSLMNLAVPSLADIDSDSESDSEPEAESKPVAVVPVAKSVAAPALVDIDSEAEEAEEAEDNSEESEEESEEEAPSKPAPKAPIKPAAKPVAKAPVKK